MNKYGFVIIFFTFLTSCHRDAYPGSKFAIPAAIRDLISCYKTGDTLIFKSSTNLIDSFVISAIDSVTINEKPLFMTPRNSKSISVYYKQIPEDKWQESWIETPHGGKAQKKSRDGTLISVVKYPDDETTEYYVNFRKFHCSKNDLPGLNRDTIGVNGLKITNYYKIQHCAINPQSPTGIKACFSTMGRGLVAFETNDSITWSRQN